MDRKLKQTSILSYWTMRYFIILCIGLLMLAAAFVWWITHETLGSRLQTVELLAQAQGGDLVLKDSSAEGTSFTLTLPLAFRSAGF